MDSLSIQNMVGLVHHLMDVVVDTACDEPNGIVEIKCPYSKQDVTPEEACKDINFYCEFKDACDTLKPNHSYYHQVQLQLYVGSDLYRWCDFCMYTTKGLSILQILPDPAWQNNISKLESFYDNYNYATRNYFCKIYSSKNTLKNTLLPALSFHLAYSPSHLLQTR